MRRSINLLLDYDAKRKIVIGITQMSRFVRRKLLLKGTHLTLGKVQEIDRSFEAVDIQLKAMTSVEEDRQ